MPKVYEVGTWHPFDKSSVYYDEMLKDVTDRAKYWNRIALIIQGLFDRSEVLHPHPPVQSWTKEGFDSAIELVYMDRLLTPGDAPDFEAYARRLRFRINGDSVVIGQERPWLKREQEREYKRRSNDWRLDWNARHVGAWWRPSGNPGPGFLAKIAEWDRSKKVAKFTWSRQKRRASWRTKGERVADSIKVEADLLFNVSAYQPGDFLQFFRDPRTRADYLKWAPLLLTAEDFHAGKLEAQEPGSDVSSD
jgi:hypothetical protein